MDFNLTEDQEMIKRSCKRFLKDIFTSKLVRELEDDPIGFRAEIWKQIADLGWMGLLIPEEYGGAGGGVLDLTVLLQEMGSGLFEGPFLHTVIGADMILEGGNELLKQQLLRQVSMGQLQLALALTEPTADYGIADISTIATLEGDVFVVDGVKIMVPYAHIANYLICVARTKSFKLKGSEGITLFLVDTATSGINFIPLHTSIKDKQFEVTFSNVCVPVNHVIGLVDQGWKILETALAKATVGECAQMVGAAQKVMEMTVQYAKDRVQFSRPIGSFQAVQHHCANMLILMQSAELITRKAAWTLDQGLPCAKIVSEAKAWVNEACAKVAALGHQIHGGIGFAMEHDLHLYTRRIRGRQYAFGDTDWHYEKVSESL